MNPRIDKDGARKAVESAYSNRHPSEHLLVTAAVDKYDVEHHSTPNMWKLIDWEGFEPSFKVIGVLSMVDLPPVRFIRNETDPVSFLNLKQEVQLTAFHGLQFGENCAMLHRILEKFNRSLGGQVEFQSPSLMGSPDSFYASNRLFTSRKQAPEAEHLEFGPGIDPNRFLSARMPGNMIHCEENVVNYWQRELIPPDQVKTFTIYPSDFHLGDIVEIVISVGAIKAKDGKYKLLVTLRDLCCLDQSFRKDAERVQQFIENPPIFSISRPAKRKALYREDSDDDRNMANNMRRLKISNTRKITPIPAQVAATYFNFDVPWTDATTFNWSQLPMNRFGNAMPTTGFINSAGSSEGSSIAGSSSGGDYPDGSIGHITGLINSDSSSGAGRNNMGDCSDMRQQLLPPNNQNDQPEREDVPQYGGQPMACEAVMPHSTATQ